MESTSIIEKGFLTCPSKQNVQKVKVMFLLDS